MKIAISSIKMPIKHNTEDVILAAQEIVRLNSVTATNFKIYKQSIDARKKNNIHYVYTVSADAAENTKCDGKIIRLLNDGEDLEIPKDKKINDRPVVVGMGPCGLFAAYILAKSGNPPLVIERGEMVEKRVKTIKHFWETNIINLNSNVQFGEGGAGTFSDGKLNTRISDPRQRYVLKTFTDHGGPEDIMYKAKPHIGTDKLRDVVASMRNEIIRLGGEVRFDTCLTDIKIKNGKVTEIQLNNSENIPCSKVILAIGHSSRDTYEMLLNNGVFIEPKPFAAGVRVEHKQSFINEKQYGENRNDLPPADYRLVYNGDNRSCYSFCMCPGGVVVNASSEEGRLVVNGMSEYKRDKENANSALVVSVRPEDFEDKSPLGGVKFQRKYEELAYKLGGGDGSAPIQNISDFLNNKSSSKTCEVKPSFTGKTKFADLRKCLPEFISNTLVDGLTDFENKMKGFSNGVMTGVEMRTSAPVRISRNEDMESINVKGLYPVGEGAGYAGGIVSAAVDGIKVALSIINEVSF